jgi:sugar lactone lactonase YvrE
VTPAQLGNPAQIARLNWQNTAAGAAPTYYLDDIRLVAENGAPEVFPDATSDGERAFVPGPSGVAVAPNGRVYVAVYQDNRVYSWLNTDAMTSGAAPDKTFGIANGDPDNGCTNGPSATVLCGPESVAVDGDGNLYVADTYNHRVVVFYNPDTDATPNAADFVLGQAAGNLDAGVANYDAGPDDGIKPGFCLARGLAVDAADNLYVVDESNHRVLKFNSPLTTDILPDLALGQPNLGVFNQGCPTLRSNQTANNRFDWPLGVAVDGANTVYVTDLHNNRVLRFDNPQADGPTASGVYNGLSSPHDVAVDPSGNVYIADTGNGRVLAYADGVNGDATHDHLFPGLSFPMGMAFDGDGNFLAADCGKPAQVGGYPPCVTDPRGVYIYNAPDAPPPPPDPDEITLAVNGAADRKPISPYIYGINEYGISGDAVTLMQELGIPLRRWGGNATSRYNWQTDISNHARDWYYGNVKESSAINLPDDSMVNRIIDQNEQANADTLLVMPLSGYVSNDNPTACGFSVQKYGIQQTTAISDGRPDCGNGILHDGTPIQNNDPLDTSIEVTEAFVGDWIDYLTTRYGTAGAGGVRFYNLDNEPDLWWETHRDVRPTGLTYDQLRDLGLLYGAAIKAADPAAQVLGPVVMGWTYYWHSPYDGQREDWATPDDRNAHGGTPLVPWYLQEMKKYEDDNGVRLLDYLDLHYYPQAAGVSLEPVGNAITQSLRLRSTRSLWDPTYVDESWIAEAGPDEGKVRLIPRMHEWVDANYPGTKLAIGEYNWGALDHINGALAQADVLGIFGREGLDLATLWEPPAVNQPGAFAFRLYRNYNGTGGKFGDMSVEATSSNQDRLAIYAAERSADGALTLVMINKTGEAITAPVTIAGFAAADSAAVFRYGEANLSRIVRLADQALINNGFTGQFAANSITLVVIPGEGDAPEPQPELDPQAFLPFIQNSAVGN